MYEIGKEFGFAAAHRLDHLPPEHKCHRLHGHNYTVEIILGTDELDEQGMVLDYGDLDPVRRYIDRELDHRNLNDVMDPTPTTAENLARMLYDYCEQELRVPDLVAVRVSEQPKTWATYRGRP